MAKTGPIKYRAFLSYSHRDMAWGKWLHAALEGYRINRDLVGRETPAGPVPKTLRPIFRDREDFSAGHSLSAQTLAALEASQFLIVVCSRNAAQSQYVNEEVRSFKKLGRGERVIPVIVDGEPGDPARDCFPPALRFKLGPDGALTDEREEPIAADARTEGDGKEIAQQKVVAGLLGLGLDEIVRRAQLARKRRKRLWAAVAGVFVLLAVAATGGLTWARYEALHNDAWRDRMLQGATDFLVDAVAKSEQLGIRRSNTVAALDKAERLFRYIAEMKEETPEIHFRKASMLLKFAHNYEALGQTEKRRERTMEAHRLMQTLVNKDPGNLAWQNDLSVTYEAIGDVLVVQGSLDEALASYQACLVIRERLAQADPRDADRQRNVSVLRARIGDVLKDQAKFDEAMASYLSAHTIALRLAQADPANSMLLRDFSVLEGRIGYVVHVRGELDQAFARYRSSLSFSQLLADSNPTDTVVLSDLFGAYLSMGEVLSDQGKLVEALANYQAGLSIIERLADSDRENAVWQKGLSRAHLSLGDSLRAQGKLIEALASFRASLAISERLGVADPANVHLRADLSKAHVRIGDVLRDQTRLDEALFSYRASLEISHSLAATDPTNVYWLDDLSTIQQRLGRVLEAQGKLDEALASYQASIGNQERLLAADPTNARWQSDLSALQLDRLIAQSIPSPRVWDRPHGGVDLVRTDDPLQSYRPSGAIVERPRFLPWWARLEFERDVPLQSQLFGNQRR